MPQEIVCWVYRFGDELESELTKPSYCGRIIKDGKMIGEKQEEVAGNYAALIATSLQQGGKTSLRHAIDR